MLLTGVDDGEPWHSRSDRRAVGGAGAADRRGPAALQGAARQLAGDERGHPLAGPERLMDEVRPPSKVPHDNLRETIEAILWRHQNGAKWRSIPGELGPWWKAAQTFIRWAHLGVWERLLNLVQQRGVALGMAF